MWAYISVIVVTDPDVQSTKKMFRARLTYTLVGCLMGLLMIHLVCISAWFFPLGIAITAYLPHLFSSPFNGWKLAPATATLIMAIQLETHAYGTAFEIGLKRAAEVFFGSLVAALVCLIVAKFDQYSFEKSDENHIVL